MGIDTDPDMWSDDDMTTTTATTDTIIWRTGEYATGGLNTQDGKLEIVTCRDCGSHIVWATSRRTGKKYRVNITRGYLDQRFYMKNNIHQCDPEAVDRFSARKARIAEAAEMTNDVVKGCRARVVKGRKYPVGTEGEVFWVADAPDQWGVVKVGMMTDAGEKVWINKDNIQREEVTR